MVQSLCGGDFGIQRKIPHDSPLSIGNVVKLKRRPYRFGNHIGMRSQESDHSPRKYFKALLYNDFIAICGA
ncbi:MAG: hypothetical protein ACTHM8_07185 [Sphingomonas sp.]